MQNPLEEKDADEYLETDINGIKKKPIPKKINLLNCLHLFIREMFKILLHDINNFKLIHEV